MEQTMLTTMSMLCWPHFAISLRCNMRDVNKNPFVGGIFIAFSFNKRILVLAGTMKVLPKVVKDVAQLIIIKSFFFKLKFKCN